MRVLGIVTARGGSKGIPRKNIASLLGKPLLAYTAQAALAARRLTRTVLSTDDGEIAEVGRAWGLEVPFLLPPNWPAMIHPPFLCCKTWYGSSKPAASTTTPSSRYSRRPRCAVPRILTAPLRCSNRRVPMPSSPLSMLGKNIQHG